MKKQMKETLTGYLFLAPSLIGFLVFLVFPIIFSLFISFTDWDLISGFDKMHFIGIQNFVTMFRDTSVVRAMSNNLIFTAVTVPLTIAFALFIAILLNDKVYAKVQFRLAFFIPYITSITAVSVVWLAMFNPASGPINVMLQSMGILNTPKWISSPQTALLSIMIISVWMGTGYCMVLYMAALQNIPQSLYEAAEIDGAVGFRRFWYITRPMLSSTTFMLLITRIITSFEVFGLISVMTGGGPVKSTTVLVYEIYINSFKLYRFGYGSAIAWFLFVVIFLVTAIQWALQKKWVYE